MRLRVHVDQESENGVCLRLLLITIRDDADLGQLRAAILQRLHHQYSQLGSESISLRTDLGYEIDTDDTDRVADLIAADTILLVRFHARCLDEVVAVDPDVPPLSVQIGLAVLAPSPDTADQALRQLCRHLTAGNIDQLGTFIVDEARRRRRFAALLDISPLLLGRLLTPSMIAACVDAAQDDGAAPMAVLAHAFGIKPGKSTRDTAQRLAQCPELAPAMTRFLQQGELEPAWTAPEIEAMDDVRFDGVVWEMVADPEQKRFRAFVKTAIQTRFGQRMAFDGNLIAVLSGLVRDCQSTWAARALGLLWRHSRNRKLTVLMAELTRTVTDPILRIHLT